MGLDHAAEGDVLLPTHVARMTEVGFLVSLLARQLHLRRVDEHHVVTGVEVRSEDRLVLAAQDASNLGGEAAERLVGRVYHPPLVLDLTDFWRIRSHALSPEKPVKIHSFE